MKIISESDWAVATIFGEAEGESLDGKTAVAEVILKRTRTKFFSDGTVAGTVLKPYQFSCWNTKSPNRIRMAQVDTEHAKDCQVAWTRALEGSALSQGAIFYLNPLAVLVLPDWVGVSYKVAHIGRHDFYTDVPPKLVHV